MAKKMQTMDGNQAAAYAAYAFTEVAGIYPITPSSPMAEYTDEWASRGMKNMFGVPVKLVEMQSEGGAAGTVHGSLQAGALTTTYTASQGLLLKIPNMYKIAGELLPGVIHVSARSLSAQALSIFGDHQDIYAARQTGFAMLGTNSVQEVMDLAGVAHLAAIKSRVPFMHFFDGFRTSHEIQKVEVMEYDDLKKLLDMDAVQAFRNRALNPEHPVTRGTAQNDDIYFQTREVQNKFYNAVPDIVADYMKEISKITGREYKPFNYYGAPDAENIIIAMGSVCEATQEVIDYLVGQGQKVGLISVHLYRPFSAKYFFDVFPKSVKRIAVLDRTKEPGALGEPLLLDVKSLFYGKEDAPMIIGGRYGLSSKDTTPAQILAVYDNLAKAEPKDGFTVGIVDDVTFTSLEVGAPVALADPSTKACLFYGLGADGTVGANKNSIKIIGDKTDLYAQGYFAYDSKKSGGVTRSHLRFGKNPIRSTYLVSRPTFVACSVPAYLHQYDMTSGIKEGGKFLLNCVWSKEEAIENIPNNIKRDLAKNKARLFILNATKLAHEIGLGQRTNTIMQAAFFKLADIIPFEEAQQYMKDYAKKSYAKKGDDIVKLNYDAIDRGANEIIEIEVDPEWVNLPVEEPKVKEASCGSACGCSSAKLGAKPETDFVKNIAKPMSAIKGDLLPVSAFLGYEDGTFENGTSAYEKRGVAVEVPVWDVDKCIQCNQCAYVCPHAVIRPFLINEEELKNAPNELATKKPMGKGLDGLAYRIQVSTLDCVGCGSCAHVCPAPGKALTMQPIAESLDAKEQENADYLFNHVEYRSDLMPVDTVKGSQFAQPLFEFHGACPGCGETPYIKLITQLYGDRMMVANATGCSSIYSGSAPSTPYTTNSCGEGPSWGSSLFEDNAEYGFGMHVAVEALRDRIQTIMENNMDKVDEELQTLFKDWIANKKYAARTRELRDILVPKLEALNTDFAREILEFKQYLVKKSQWIIGGDGWAYDIGYGGLDHVLASNEDVNILVMDTEVYSNTGGQASKATPTGAVAKFAAAGKSVKKKDLAAIAMSYGHIYVAQVSMGANQQQFINAVKEAEAHQGPSIIIAYSPCINHGIKKGMSQSQTEMKLATECGYWPIFRYNPSLEKLGKNPLKIDSREPKWEKYEEYLLGEVRFQTLTKSNPEEAKVLFELNKKEAQKRWRQYKRLAALDYAEEKEEVAE
ncbi:MULTISPECIES: pyruvate:ferredoxin (flavodoxin) oxidoreductase [Fusobacterium]|uniref:pyruvate:ferredoxin (flavodoxin) oxidoreductase n=1 Tax=Fusobacterium TaxID=848 RepID=UPI0025B8245B|nr:pyruvate:ferredoxin (flavodoxin) oxidoreductase [Fusobacterium sp.]MDD7411392.1 pyruvate:ferredoxin (flavodoxin) oxidoreductase [Fusobacteriaceae bacterium]MDY5305851.1 pyruvate:ferredoxin (flavodoxin) oxidoreductase [Fusobacterium gastrosuis]MCI5725683.1 pyruvate:ferredoxin (flavodoxin) oxidoreductase [Fusobacterium sp.]MCI7223961.1 pyruvate:ferredoxin (flavodoxin) oxidoreductase [Fusobacterium sp.]MDY5713746.1 pyruvate:ferredoxin (flavodoxin) oxidoreductase [Fusobacterium gastrosuis]